jgi:hypothetical protein
MDMFDLLDGPSAIGFGFSARARHPFRRERATITRSSLYPAKPDGRSAPASCALLHFQKEYRPVMLENKQATDIHPSPWEFKVTLLPGISLRAIGSDLSKFSTDWNFSSWSGWLGE